MGEDGLASLDQCLADALAPDSALRQAIASLAEEEGVGPEVISELFAETVVLGITWQALSNETAASVRSLVELAPSALRLIARELRTLVAEASDANAVAAYDDRRSLTKTELIATVSRVASQIDVAALESALRIGICEPLELFQGAAADDRYYEGTATQPFHVGAGLVVPRPDVVAEVLAGLAEQSAAVITGPSGVGKSAVLWTVPLAAPGVTWFRVSRLADEDVSELIRLARAYNASVPAPVGFLVDGVGVGEIRGWARLRAEAAQIPGLLLVGSVRTEDLSTMGDLSGCATVRVALDESAAEAIFGGLLRRGSTSVTHWREAFDRSNGLTLEFTHMLTKGQRLTDVIREQVRRRIDEGRLAELDVLSLVSVADRWAATLTSVDVAVACGASGLELRQAVTRLTDEHLVVERDGMMFGLHRLRSTAISVAIHEKPPPDLNATLRRVLSLVPTDLLHRFVAGALSEEPSASSVVIEVGAAERLMQDRLIAYLHGLRLADFHELAKEWKRIADEHDVPASSQPVLFQFAAGGLEFPDLFPDAIRNARAEMGATAGPCRAAQLVDRVGLDTIVDLLTSCQTAQGAARLLATLDDDGAQLASVASERLIEDCELVKALASSGIEELADCLAAARACDLALADQLVDLVGGPAELLRRLRAEHPWVTEIDVRTKTLQNGKDELIGYCRLLHVSEDAQGDPREQAVRIGQLMLRCLPKIESVDVQALLPGGHELRIGDYTHGVSGLRRQYDHTKLSVSWNQARLRTASILLGATDTERLSAALPLLGEADRIARQVGTALVLGDAARVDFDALAESVTALDERARSLKPALGAAEIGDTPIGEEATVPIGDDLSGLLTDLTGNIVGRLTNRDNFRAVEAFIADTTIGTHLAGAMRQPWHLLGIDGHPDSLDRLQVALLDLHAVVHEMAIEEADLARVGRSARSGTSDRALHRAAETCRRSEQRRRQVRRESLLRTCQASGLRTVVLKPDATLLPAMMTDWGVAVEVASLLDWPGALEALTSALGAQQPLGEAYVIIPLRESRPVPSLAVRLITSPLPVTDLDEWSPQLAEPHPSHLADAFSRAQTALQALSGIAELPRGQRDHPAIEAVRSAALDDLDRAQLELRAAPTDVFTSELLSVVDALAVEVDAEIEGKRDDASVAAQIAAALVGDDSNTLFDVILGGRYLALEWDIDPEQAVELFRS